MPDEDARKRFRIKNLELLINQINTFGNPKLFHILFFLEILRREERKNVRNFSCLTLVSENSANSRDQNSLSNSGGIDETIIVARVRIRVHVSYRALTDSGQLLAIIVGWIAALYRSPLEDTLSEADTRWRYIGSSEQNWFRSRTLATIIPIRFRTRFIPPTSRVTHSAESLYFPNGFCISLHSLT